MNESVQINGHVGDKYLMAGKKVFKSNVRSLYRAPQK